MVKEKCPAKDKGGDESVQEQRAGEIYAEPVAIRGFITCVLELSGYGTLLTSRAAG